MSDTKTPRVFISYVHYEGTESNREHVLTLAQKLRNSGIDCVLDQFVETTPPPQGFPRWMLDQVESADFVLVVCTPTYYRRFRAKENPDVGLGGTWEGGIIVQELYEGGGQNSKFIPVGFDRYDIVQPSIPEPLRPTIYRNLNSEEGIEMLLRQLYGVPLVVPQALGERPKFASETPSVTTATNNTTTPSTDRIRLITELQDLDSTSLTRIINLVPEAHRYDTPNQAVAERVRGLMSFAEGSAGPGADAVARAAVAALPQLQDKIGSFI